MSGAEAFAVVGLIASVISIIETSRHLYDAATSAKGLPEAFRVVSTNVSLVLEILRSCKHEQEKADEECRRTADLDRKAALEQSASAVRPIMQTCEENAQQLQAIFEKVVPGERATWLERYSKAARAVMPGKKHRVEDLMKSILEQLQLLHTNQFFKTIIKEKDEDVTAAIDRLSEVPSSLPDENGSFHHSGTGPMKVNSGSGTQTNNTISGGSGNKMFNAQTQHFRDD